MATTMRLVGGSLLFLAGFLAWPAVFGGGVSPDAIPLETLPTFYYVAGALTLSALGCLLRQAADRILY